MLGKIEGTRRRGDRKRDGWMASLTEWTWLNKLQEMVKDREAWHTAVHGVTKRWTWLSNWKTTTNQILLHSAWSSRILSQFCLMNTWWMVWGWLPLMWCWGNDIGSSSMKSPGDITPGKSHMGDTATRPRLSRSVQQGNSPITWQDQKLEPECFSGYFCFVFFFS